MNVARELWQRIETIHAVTYFAPESSEAAKACGLKGFWMGYFGFRASPLGRASTGAVHASFANFAQPMVQRSIPDAWDYADPATLISARATAAAAALRRVSPDIDDLAPDLIDVLAAIVGAAAPIGRPLFAANAQLAPRQDSVEQLWQHCTSLREHRGDGHVMALALAGIDGCGAHHLHVADRGVPAEILRDNRGFDQQQWDAAGARLEQEGLLSDGMLTPTGRSLVDDVEHHTDRLAAVPIDHVLARNDQKDLVDQLDALARPVALSGLLPFPNPMGLPTLGDQASR